MDTIAHLGFIVIALFVTIWQSTLYFKGNKYLKGNKNIWLSLLMGSSFVVLLLSIGFTFWSNFVPTWISQKLGLLFYLLHYLLLSCLT